MSQKKQPSNPSFGRHPVVSTILWILGTEIQTTPDHTDLSDDKSNTLSWKDDHGGHIAEYMNHIQRSAHPTHQNLQSLQQDERERRNSMQLQKPSHEHDEMTSQSPQWGFYVPITPPQQETFAAQNKSNQPSTLPLASNNNHTSSLSHPINHRPVNYAT